MWFPGIPIPLIYTNRKVTGFILCTCMTCVYQVTARNVIFFFFIPGMTIRGVGALLMCCLTWSGRCALMMSWQYCWGNRHAFPRRTSSRTLSPVPSVHAAASPDGPASPPAVRCPLGFALSEEKKKEVTICINDHSVALLKGIETRITGLPLSCSRLFCLFDTSNTVLPTSLIILTLQCTASLFEHCSSKTTISKKAPLMCKYLH